MITQTRKIEEFLQILINTWIIGPGIAHGFIFENGSLVGHINQHLEHGVRFSLNHFEHSVVVPSYIVIALTTNFIKF
jgi:hypothetical protein